MVNCNQSRNDLPQFWYIVKRSEGRCEIFSNDQVEGEDESNFVERWGPFDSQQEAIARRVGLIRAGKCQPA
ncbi:MAG TPA: DDE transposase family protein [Cyanobacteria bacterium UBA8803]|nr:DDE transposase family protein [Cyanobacteria bacterium UBA9273]HBL59963.1 DDE transposase family protein [Cyanobacteria bacterium UBA8803]